MTLEDKIKLVELMEYTFTNSNSIIGYYMKDDYVKGDTTAMYTAEVFEYSKSTALEPKTIYKQTTIVSKGKSELDCKLDFYLNAFMLLPAGLGVIYDAVNADEVPEPTTVPTSTKVQSLNQVEEKGTPVPTESSDVRESFIVDCDTDRTPAIQILPILKHSEVTEKLEDTYDDSRGVVTALCYALASMIRSVERRGLEKPGDSMRYAMNLVEDLYADPDYEQI
jgi:hypothetical protein